MVCFDGNSSLSCNGYKNGGYYIIGSYPTASMFLALYNFEVTLNNVFSLESTTFSWKSTTSESVQNKNTTEGKLILLLDK